VEPSRSEHPVELYIREVLSGETVACGFVRMAVRRHLRDLERQNTEAFPYYFDPDAGQHVIDFFRYCRHFKGEWSGQVIRLEPWQQFILWVLFGWKRSKNGYRRFRLAYIEVARGNGKSVLVGGIGLYLLAADGERGAEIYSAATKRDQAKILFDYAREMVRQSPELSSMIDSYRNNLSVVATASKFEPLASDDKKMDGYRISGGLIDELHAHPTRGVYDVIETGTGARRQPLIICITTAGTPSPNSICLEKRNQAEKVLTGVLEDETFFPIIFTLDEGDDPFDESKWAKANPNLGISVSLEDELRPKALRARETPSAQANFKTKHLNIWVSSRSRWVPVERWDACREDFSPAELIGKECFAGLDLSTTTDISSLVLVFPWENDTIRVLPFYWVPLENADLRARRDRVPYPAWISAGNIEGTPGNVIDYGFIRKKIVALADVYKFRELAADPWNATQILQQLQEEDGLPVLEMRQGFASMSSPMKTLEALVMSQKLRHPGCPVMRWMWDNISVKMDPAGNVKPDKEKSAERIDGVVAMVMAVGRAALRKPEAANPYEAGGLFAL
jgi:phage terminase large subunit-like protein